MKKPTSPKVRISLCVLLTLIGISSAQQPAPLGTGRLLKGHRDGISDFAIAPSGKWVAAVEGRTNDVYLWSLPDGKKIGVLDGPVGRHFGGLAISPDDTEICLVLEQRLVRWQTTKIGGPVETTVSQDKEDLVVSPAYSHDKKLLVFSLGGRLMFWSREAGKLLETGSRIEMTAAQFSPSDKTVIGRSGVKGKLAVLDVGTGKNTILHKKEIGYVSGISIVDEEHVFSCGWGGFADLWNVKKGRTIFTIEQEDTEFTCLAYNRKTDRLAIGTARKGLKVWDVKGRKEVAILFPQHSIAAVAFSPDGECLLASFGDPFGPGTPNAGKLAIVDLKK